MAPRLGDIVTIIRFAPPKDLSITVVGLKSIAYVAHRVLPARRLHCPSYATQCPNHHRIETSSHKMYREETISSDRTISHIAYVDSYSSCFGNGSLNHNEILHLTNIDIERLIRVDILRIRLTLVGSAY